MANINNSKTDRKPAFLEALKKSKGIIQPALNAVKIERQTYLNWYRDDIDFKRAVDEISEYQIDFVEEKLLKNINKGDATSIIFYLKTKGKSRGYIEKREMDITTEGRAIETNPVMNMPFAEIKKLYNSIQGKKKTPTRKTNAKK